MNRLGYRGGERYAIALETIKAVLKLSREIGELEFNSLLEVPKLCLCKTKKFHNAYETYKDYMVIHDSILNDETKKQITHKKLNMN